MAIIKYTLDNGNTPDYITNGGMFYNRSDSTYIGIGSGGGTEITKSELITRALAMHANRGWSKWDSNSPHNTVVTVDLDDAGVTAVVNEWCTAMGVS